MIINRNNNQSAIIISPTEIAIYSKVKKTISQKFNLSKNLENRVCISGLFLLLKSKVEIDNKPIDIILNVGGVVLYKNQ